MIPGDEVAIRKILRYLRSAEDDLRLASQIGPFLIDELSPCHTLIDLAIERTEDELTQLRRTT